jgi:hypothetical protein
MREAADRELQRTVASAATGFDYLSSSLTVAGGICAANSDYVHDGTSVTQAN